MGLSFTQKYPNGRFKFERSGMFGKGDYVYVYQDGEKIDEFELEDSDKEYLNETKNLTFFKGVCVQWYMKYGQDL